jgi:hypothetical protein
MKIAGTGASIISVFYYFEQIMKNKNAMHCMDIFIVQKEAYALVTFTAFGPLSL